MKFWNLTYNDPDRWREVYEISGKPAGFWKAIRSGATGSPRGVIKTCSSNEMNDLLGATSAIKYCNFQSTEAGAILFVRVRLEVYGLPIRRKTIHSIEFSESKENASWQTMTIINTDDSFVQFDYQKNKHMKMMKFMHRYLHNRDVQTEQIPVVKKSS